MSLLAPDGPGARAALAAALLLAAGCAKATNPGGPLDRPILDAAPGAAAANQAALPAGFPGPRETACAADTTRSFLGEMADHPVADAQVLLHWAPVVPGPVAGKGSVLQPEIAAAGRIVSWNLSDLDTSFDHPFGFDFNVNVAPDAPFQALVKNRDAENTDLHVELEAGLFPAAFGWTPANGDRALVKGAWIFDCGHPPYETELHPPSFVAFARAADARTTTALAFAVPWRVTQLFGPVAAVADFFTDPRRLREKGTPFPQAFQAEVVLAAATNKDHLEAHALLEALRFEAQEFSVCAPSPRPPAVALRYSHRFTARTGVTVAATVREEQGCVDYRVTMGAAYLPAEPSRQDHPWPWAEISQQASDQSGQSLDVRQLVAGALAAAGGDPNAPALREDHPPVIDRYAPLVPGAGAALDGPHQVAAGADGQPFPFHGRVRVWWE